MTSAPLKIRCYNCNQLLGVNRNKAGGTIVCPKCSSEVVVPGLDAFDLAQLNSGSQEEAATPIVRDDASLLSQGLAAIDFTTVTRSSPPELEPILPILIEERPAESPPRVEPPSLPPIQVETPRKLRQARKPSTLGPGTRDLLIPRSIVAAWSLLVLFALAFAFASGLLAGHYVWQDH